MNNRITIVVVFAKEVTQSGEKMTLSSALRGSTNEYKTTQWSDDTEIFVSQVMERIIPTTLTNKETIYVYFRGDFELKYDAKAYSNFEITLSNRTLYRLDE